MADNGPPNKRPKLGSPTLGASDSKDNKSGLLPSGSGMNRPMQGGGNVQEQPQPAHPGGSGVVGAGRVAGGQNGNIGGIVAQPLGGIIANHDHQRSMKLNGPGNASVNVLGNQPQNMNLNINLGAGGSNALQCHVGGPMPNPTMQNEPPSLGVPAGVQPPLDLQPSGLGSPEDAASRAAAEAQKQKRMMQILVFQHMALIIHAYKCLRLELAGANGGAEHACNLPHCETMKLVIQHMRTCNFGNSCQVDHCASSRQIIWHLRNCAKRDCRYCLAAKNASDRKGNATAA